MPSFNPVGEFPLSTIGEVNGLDIIATADFSSVSLFTCSAKASYKANLDIQTISDISLFGGMLALGSAKLDTISQLNSTSQIIISNITASFVGVTQFELVGQKSAVATAKFDNVNQLFNNAQVSHLSSANLIQIAEFGGVAKGNKGGEANLSTIFSLEPRFALTLGGLARLAGISAFECAAQLATLPTVQFGTISVLSSDGNTDAGEANLITVLELRANARVDYINTANLATLVDLVCGGGLIHTATTILPIICAVGSTGGLSKTSDAEFQTISQIEVSYGLSIISSARLSSATQFNNLATVDRGGGTNKFRTIVAFHSEAGLDISETVNSTADFHSVSSVFAEPFTYDVESSSDGDGWSFYVCLVY